MARITFDPDEAEQLRTSARERVATEPALAYVLLQLADEGIDLEKCTPWEELRERYGMPPLDDATHDVA